MRYLVTGGAGFIGSHLCDALLRAGHEVLVLDDLSTGKHEQVPLECEFLKADCGDRRILSDVIDDVDGVFHLAAIASVQRSVAAWSDTSRVNQFATIALLEAVTRREGGVIPLVYASSAAVYGDPQPQYLPLAEATPTLPITPYGADKLGCELHARLARGLFGIPTLGMRFFNVYGARQDPSSPYSGVISIFVKRIVAGEPICIYGDGEQSRDFIYVGDVAARLTQAMALLHKFIPAPHALNVCTGVEVSISQLAYTIAALCGITPDIRYEAPRAGDIRRSLGNTSLLQATLGEQVPTTLAEGLKTLL